MRIHSCAKTVVRWLVIALCLCTLLASATRGPAMHAQYRKSPSKLSPRLALLAQPAVATQSVEAQARALSLPPTGPGSLLRSTQGRVLVYIRLAEVAHRHLRALEAGGAQVVHVGERYRTVTAYVHPADLAQLADLDVVENVREALAPHRSEPPPGPADSPGPVTLSSPGAQAGCAGSTTTEGYNQLRVSDVYTTYSLDGSGVTVGVLSDSYARVGTPTSAISDVLSNDLPGAGNTCGHTVPVTVTQEYTGTGPSDEGRAMLQIVHDLAPGAHLAFATAAHGLYDFADNIRRLRNEAGAEVIVDDVFYYDEPFFQDGPVDVAIQDVTANGATYLTAAGNSHVEVGGRPVGSYEAAAYRPVTCPVLLGPWGYFQYPDCHDFDPGAGADSDSHYTLAEEGYLLLVLQWAEPWYGVQTDLDIWLVDGAYNVLDWSMDFNTGPSGSQEPFEFLSYMNPLSSPQDVYLVIGRYEGPAPRLKYVLFRSGGLLSVEYTSDNNPTDTFGPTIAGHSGTQEAISVAAVPYDDAHTPQDFTSWGYATRYFGPVVGVVPAPPLPAPQTRYKPDVAATNGGLNTFFGSSAPGGYRFYGTSAAAPHAAAVAALMEQRADQRSVGLSYALTEAIMEQTAATMTNGRPEANGTGLIDALGTITGVNGIASVFLPASSRAFP